MAIDRIDRRPPITLGRIMYLTLAAALGATAWLSRAERDAAVKARRAADERVDRRAELVVALDEAATSTNRELTRVRAELENRERFIGFLERHGVLERFCDPPPPEIEGEVLGVLDRTQYAMDPVLDPDGVPLVVIDIGREAGLSERVKLYAYRGARGADFVARLEARRVLSDRTICRVVFGDTLLRRGDQVTTWMR